MEYWELSPWGRGVFSALIQCILQDRSLWGGQCSRGRIFASRSKSCMTCRMEVAVDRPGSLLLSCSPVVAETVSDGFGGLAYIHFGAFTIDDGIDEVGTGAGEGICEVEGLFRDSRGDGMVGKELGTGSTEGMMAELYMHGSFQNLSLGGCWWWVVGVFQVS